MKNLVIILLLSVFGPFAQSHDMPDQTKADVIESLTSNFVFYGQKPKFEKSTLRLSFAEFNFFKYSIFAHIFVGDKLREFQSKWDDDLEEFHFVFSTRSGRYKLNCSLSTTELPLRRSYEYRAFIGSCQVRKMAWFSRYHSVSFHAHKKWNRASKY